MALHELSDEKFGKACSTIQLATVCGSVVAFGYMIIVTWWVGVVGVWHAEEVLKHETCYVAYKYNEAHKINTVVVEYCGAGAEDR